MGACSGVVRSGKLLISAHFRSFLSLRGAGAGMRGSRLHGNDGGVARSGELLILFRLVPFRSPRTLILTWIPAFAGMTGQGAGMRGSRLHGNDGGRGVNPWPYLALFTPSGEAENEATVASFGTPLTRTQWASGPWLWPWLASSGVAGSGETFNSVAFGCISLHSLSPNPHPCLDSSLRWNGGTGGRDARFPLSRERRGHSW